MHSVTSFSTALAPPRQDRWQVAEPAGWPPGHRRLPIVPVPAACVWVLALYTDGLIEARDHDIEAGIAMLGQALAQPAGLPTWDSP